MHCDSARRKATLHDMAWHGTAWYGMAWHGMALHDSSPYLPDSACVMNQGHCLHLRAVQVGHGQLLGFSAAPSGLYRSVLGSDGLAA